MGCGPFRERSFPRGTKPLCGPPGELLGKQSRSSKAKRHHTTCKEYQDQECHHCTHVVLKTVITEASNYHFCPIVTCFLRKNWLRSFPRGRKPLCRPPTGLLGKPSCSSKGERHHTTFKEYQDQECQHCKHVVHTTLIPEASKCQFCPNFCCSFQKNGVRSFPRGTKPLCPHHGELWGK